MAIETYTLGELKKRIRNEFSTEDVPHINEKIKDKINEAYLWICRSRRNWFWMLTEGTLDVQGGTTATIDFTHESKTAQLVSGSVGLRSVLNFGDSSGGSIGYVVLGVSGTTLTLDRQWLGTTGEHEVNVDIGYIALPEDFLSIDHGSQVSDHIGNYFKFFDTQRFFELRNRTTISMNWDRVYTILPNPLKSNDLRYLAVFPYLRDATSIVYSYYRMPQKLDQDTDTPILSLMDRPCLLYASLWLYGASVGFEGVQTYRDMALDDLRRMSEHADEDNTVNFDSQSGDSPLDLSGTRMSESPFDGDYNPPII